MSDTKPLLVPGDTFTVAYGNDQQTDVVCLSLLKQRRLADLVKKMIAAEQSGDSMQCMELFENAEEAIRLVKPGVSDDFLDSIDAQAAIEISGACLGKQAIGDSDRKKSE